MHGAEAHRRFVTSLRFFKGFTEGEIDVLMGVLRERRIEDRQPLFRQGDPGRACYIVAAGAIQVTVGEGPREQPVAMLGEGELFGQVALVDGGRRSASCIASGETIVLELGRNEFDLLFNSGSSFAFKFLDVLTRILVGQLRSANERLVSVAERERSARKPKSAQDPEMQQFFQDIARRTSSFRDDDFDLDDVQVVYSEADRARQR